MTLIDTSVWIDHLRRADPGLQALLREGSVWTHPFVVGEIACGSLRARGIILALLGSLPTLEQLSRTEVLAFVEAHALGGAGLGWLDVHLLASARLAHTPLWTRDRRLALAAERLGIGAR